jgi:hypothetical protein
MSKTINHSVVAVKDLGVKELKKVSSSLDLFGRSSWNKLDLITNIENSLVSKVILEADSITPVVSKLDKVKRSDIKTIKTTSESYQTLIDVAIESGVSKPQAIVEEAVKHLTNGVKLGQFVSNPEKYGVDVKWIPTFRKVDAGYNLRSIKVPTRKSVASIEVKLENGVIDGDKVRVKGTIVRQSQSQLADTISKGKSYFISENGKLVRADKYTEGAKSMLDMTNMVYVDAKMELEKDENGNQAEDLTPEQKKLQFTAMNGGIIVEVNGEEVEAEYVYQTPSQQRLVQATFCADMDPIEVLEKLGHDFRCYAKKNSNDKWVIDMSKAIKRFGLAGTNTISSSLVKIGNDIESFDNGDIHLVGGTHTMRVTQGAHTYVKAGTYNAYDDATGDFFTIDAKDHSRKLAAGDGLVFCDHSVYASLVAEFGLDTSAWQVRITPFTKGLMVFVPGLKDMYDADIVAFDTAVKGNYETLVKKQPEFNIEVRIALFNKPARMSKKYTNIPYQFVNTLPVGPSAYIKMADKHLDRAFDLYKDPKLMAEYLGLNVLSDLENISDEDLTEDERVVAENTLVSRFTEFLYAGDFTMKDPMMKKYAKDIIENVIKEWTYGSIPVEGHYRFMVQDVYAIMETKILFDECEVKGLFNPYKDIDGDIIIPSHIGLPADTVFMIDDNDKHIMEGVDVVFNRNPKIAYGETAIATTVSNKQYALAHYKYKGAFTNLAIFSVHDFNTFKQGGADNDGDTTFATTQEVLVEAVQKKQFPALLDITIKDGQFIEGCPYSNPEMDKNEFKREFSDDEYSRDLARELHELSKVYVLRALEPNNIGALTNYATKLLDAVTKLTIAINDNQTVDGSPLSDDAKKSYHEEIKTYLHYIDILRLAQGWEIDKAKHGGYYKEFIDLSFTVGEGIPFFASKKTKFGKTWINPDWMAARKGKAGEDTGSLISRIRNHVKSRFEDEIVEQFKGMDPVSSDNNIAAELSLAVQKPSCYSDILKEMRTIRTDYKLGFSKAIQWKDSQLVKMNNYISNQDGPVSDHKKEGFVVKIEQVYSELIDSNIQKTSSRLSALEVLFNVEPAVIGLAAYELTYADNNDINRNIKRGEDPTVGLSFPWSGAKYHLLSAVRLVSGKDIKFSNIEKVEASDIEIRIGGLITDPVRGIDAQWIKDNALAQGKIYVWNQPITDANDPLCGYHVFSVYVGSIKVGNVFANKAHAFSGHDKWEVKVKDVSFKENKQGGVSSMGFVLDSVTPFSRK